MNFVDYLSKYFSFFLLQKFIRCVKSPADVINCLNNNQENFIYLGFSFYSLASSPPSPWAKIFIPQFSCVCVFVCLHNNKYILILSNCDQNKISKQRRRNSNLRTLYGINKKTKIKTLNEREWSPMA